jgi:transcription elongation GreA/GreB family factor
MSKAFTKDENAPEAAPALPPIAEGRFWLTHTGAQQLRERSDPRVAAALASADPLPPVGPNPERGAIGVTLTLRNAAGELRKVRLVTPEEQRLLGDGCSVRSPLGRALLGAELADEREVALPRGVEVFEIEQLEGENG